MRGEYSMVGPGQKPYTAYDFIISWYDKEPCTHSVERQQGLTHSSVIVRDSKVYEFTIRFPPIPKNKNNAREVEQLFRSVFNSASKIPISVKIIDDKTVYTPHAMYKSKTNPQPIDIVVQSIHRMWSKYRNSVSVDGTVVYSRAVR